MTGKGVLKSRKQGKTLLAQCRKVAANATEVFCTLVGSELS